MSILNTIRMVPANGTAQQVTNGVVVTTTVNGRSYSCAVGSTIDVPEFDAPALQARGLFVRLDTSGPTSQRPAYPPNANSDARIAASPIGYRMIDTTLGVAICFNGAAWVNVVTGAIV
jgi:hypothetical protein